MTMKYY